MTTIARMKVNRHTGKHIGGQVCLASIRNATEIIIIVSHIHQSTITTHSHLRVGKTASSLFLLRCYLFDGLPCRGGGNQKDKTAQTNQ